MPLQLMGTMKSAVGKLMQGGGPFGPGAPGEGTVATTATGEHRGYRPAAPGTATGRTAQQSAIPPESHTQQTSSVNAYTAYGQQSAQSGFGGMLDRLLSGHRARRAQKQAQQDMYAQQPFDPGMALPYQQPQPDWSGYQAPVYAQPEPSYQTAYQQPQSEAYAQTGYQPQSADYAQPPYQPQPEPYSYTSARPVYGGNDTASAQFGANAPYQPQPEQSRSRRGSRRSHEAAENNVLYMNQGGFVDENGTAYRMVMRLAQPLSTSKCYRIIEFMRNGETVLVNTEMIKEDREVTRCLDLLYGASYALNCTCTRAASRCLYVISPRDVHVLPYASLEDLNQRDAAQRWPGSDPANPRDRSWDRPTARSARPERPAAPGYRPADDFGASPYQAAYAHD